jgi:hypothetical protein
MAKLIFSPVKHYIYSPGLEIANYSSSEQEDEDDEKRDFFFAGFGVLEERFFEFFVSNARVTGSIMSI